MISDIFDGVEIDKDLIFTPSTNLLSQIQSVSHESACLADRLEKIFKEKPGGRAEEIKRSFHFPVVDCSYMCR